MINNLSYNDRPKVYRTHTEPSILGGTAHAITENILLGAVDSSRVDKKDELSSYNVTGIINCCPQVHDNAFEDDGSIEYCSVSVNDIESANILQWLNPAGNFMHKHISNGGTCLVHCQMGVSRSSSVVIAYLMRYQNMNLHDAYTLTKMKRPIVDPNGGFWEQLQQYEKSLMDVPSLKASFDEEIQFDEEWMESTFVATCAGGQELNAFSELICCGDVDVAKDALKTGLYFVLGKGLGRQEMKWLSTFGAACTKSLEALMKVSKNDVSDESQSPNDCSLARDEILRIIVTEEFQEDWGSDFGNYHKSQVLKALSL